MSDFIPEANLENGRIYRIRSRNLLVGLWRAESRGFIGVREKFGEKYLFEEFHHDSDPHCGTANAIGALPITHPVPDQYWKDDLGLFKVLLPLDEEINKELLVQRAIEDEERESRRWAPITEAEFLKQRRMAEVVAWRREQVDAITADFPTLDTPGRKERVKALDEEWMKRLRKAINPDKEWE